MDNKLIKQANEEENVEKFEQESLPLEEEVKKEEVVEEKPISTNIDLSEFKKKKFTINGDIDKIIELDPSDLNIITRLQNEYPKLQAMAKKMDGINIEGLDEETTINKVGSTLKEIDMAMRKCVDTIFDYPVSDVCVPTASMYDPINGKFRFEILIDKLSVLYNANLSAEIKKIESRVNSRTNKYTRKK